VHCEQWLVLGGEIEMRDDMVRTKKRGSHPRAFCDSRVSLYLACPGTSAVPNYRPVATDMKEAKRKPTLPDLQWHPSLCLISAVVVRLRLEQVELIRLNENTPSSVG
jgi:hypothetical protein